MKLYLMQHGHALSKEENPGRPLSERGRPDVQKTAHFLKKSGVYFPDLWHSTKMRAKQTAEIIAAALDPRPSVQEKPGLEPQDPVHAMAASLADHQRDLCIVGHLPQLDKLSSQLVCGRESAQVVQFQPGGIVCLQKSPEEKWSVNWMMIPELLSAAKS